MFSFWTRDVCFLFEPDIFQWKMENTYKTYQISNIVNELMRQIASIFVYIFFDNFLR